MCFLRLRMFMMIAFFVACRWGNTAVAQQRTGVRESPEERMSLSRGPGSCPVTKPPASLFVPPPPYPKHSGHRTFWFGTEKLWTRLPIDGTWVLRNSESKNSGFTQKLLWWRRGYDWRANPEPQLSVTGERLNASGLALVTRGRATNGWTREDLSFMLIAIDIPTFGCWKFTGHYQGEALSFVTWIPQ